MRTTPPGPWSQMIVDAEDLLRCLANINYSVAEAEARAKADQAKLLDSDSGRAKGPGVETRSSHKADPQVEEKDAKLILLTVHEVYGSGYFSSDETAPVANIVLNRHGLHVSAAHVRVVLADPRADEWVPPILRKRCLELLGRRRAVMEKRRGAKTGVTK